MWGEEKQGYIRIGQKREYIKQERKRKRCGLVHVEQWEEVENGVDWCMQNSGRKQKMVWISACRIVGGSRQGCGLVHVEQWEEVE